MYAPARHGSTGRASICLVHSPCEGLDDDRLEPPLGLLYLASVARNEGRDVHVVDLSSCCEDDLAARIPGGFDVYGFSTYSVNYGVTRKLAADVRERNPASRSLAGGPHATALPDLVSQDGFDVVVTGEGEQALSQVLAVVDAGKPIPPVVRGESPEPLDALPFPDYECVDLGSYSRELAGERCLSVLSSRGCPYRCTFCNSNVMGAGSPIRFRSPDNVVEEIRRLKERYGIRHFRFQDDIFTISLKRIRELTPHLAREDIVYRCFARVNTCVPEMARLLREGGCVHASFGVETGSPKLLSRHAMHKGQTPDEVRRALENAAEVGLRSRVFLIVGFPGETDETIEETLALMKSCPWDEFSVYPLIAYPGTPIHEDPESFGITHIDRSYEDYLQIGKNFRAGFTIRTSEFDENRVEAWRDHVISALLADGRTWAGHSEGFK